jgi:hypothetical protein
LLRLVLRVSELITAGSLAIYVPPIEDSQKALAPFLVGISIASRDWSELIKRICIAVLRLKLNEFGESLYGKITSATSPALP